MKRIKLRKDIELGENKLAKGSIVVLPDWYALKVAETKAIEVENSEGFTIKEDHPYFVEDLGPDTDVKGMGFWTDYYNLKEQYEATLPAAERAKLELARMKDKLIHAALGTKE